ncbi:MAG: 30S ribosomal protein S16 [Candidatus Omnitrophica bacterium]|nr:30S ribosomal protein S16 [Candidatus Omnitrophota bacterium]
MEVRLRLQKSGKPAKGRYNYRVVAIARSKGRDARHLEILGHYDPAKEPANLFINLEKADKWIQSGAQMSDTVKSLVNQERDRQASEAVQS